jgi:hypothetical protein
MRTNSRSLWYLALPILILAVCVLQLPAQAQQTTTGISCSQVAAKHLVMQDNMRAGLTLVQCGVVQGGKPAAGHELEEDAPQPPNVLISNKTCSSGTACTRSESMVWHSTQPGNNTVVTNFNAEYGTGRCYDGLAYSTDGGTTFTEIEPLCTSSHGTNYGDPLVVYNQKLGLWFAGDLVSGGDCGGQGVGIWSSPDGQNWTVSGCAHNGSDDDRPSMWVDNNPFSSKYGRMYVSFNNFDVDGGALFVAHSDNGSSWGTPAQLTSAFIREVQITGAPPGPPGANATYTSPVFEFAMNEGGGGLSQRQNMAFRSLDGGSTWTQITVGQPFNPPGDGTCGYFALMNPIWRHMGWGEPGVGPNGVVHYAYATKGSISTGDIYYTRSADNGNTWSTPILLNDPETNQYQSHWMPSLSVNYSEASFSQPEDVTVSWYDRRQASSACNSVTDPGCNYQRYGIQSSDNGVTWGSNIEISNVIIPEPAQNDPFVQSCYAGDYDYSTAFGSNAYVTWTDGRVNVGGVQVQSVEGAVVAEP